MNNFVPANNWSYLFEKGKCGKFMAEYILLGEN